MLHGEKVSLTDMLTCRERRAETQNENLQNYNNPVLSFCMNIPGPIKTTPELFHVFQDGANHILHFLADHNYTIINQTEYHDKTGDELILCVDCPDVQQLKKAMTEIEETHPFGRLFDIDVINSNGEKLSRAVFRKCFICNRQAQDCASSRRHSVEEMQMTIEKALFNGHF